MHRRMRTQWWVVGVLLIGTGWGQPGVSACQGSSEACPSYVEGSSRKLGRGISNVLTAPLELIRQPYLMSEERSSGLAGATEGLVKGIWWTLGRELAGVYDVVTFYAPIPKGFRSLIRPEYIYTEADWSPETK